MSLREVLIDELKDLYSAENQQVKAMPKAVKSAETDELKQIFTTSLEQTKGQVERLKQVFEHIGKKATGKHCSGMEGAIDEVKEALEEDEEGAVFDAGLIGAALRVEHYEIAGYTAAVMMAKAIGEKEIADLLTQTLNEEAGDRQADDGCRKEHLQAGAAGRRRRRRAGEEAEGREGKEV